MPDINDLGERIIGLKNEVREAQQQLASLRGQKEAVVANLQEEFGVKTVKGAERKLKDLNKEYKEGIDNLEERIGEVEDVVYEDEDTEGED